MFQATVYIESEGKIEKLTGSFESIGSRIDWLIQKLLSTNFQYMIVNGESVTTCN